jgi:RNA polymerase sigma factor (sigma-70 family)
MDAPPSLKKNWVLTQEAFNGLLARLDPLPERAATKYEDIRESLILFFECRGSHSPEDHTDETINRVARRLEEGKQIYTANLTSYFYGVASNILKEQWAAPGRLSSQIDSSHSAKELSLDVNELIERDKERQEHDQRLECLEICLHQLTLNNRELIKRYYQGQSNVKVNNRKQMAEQFGISLNALRNKALRIREKLESCVVDCLRGSA